MAGPLVIQTITICCDDPISPDCCPCAAPVTTPCCSNPLPTTLYATVTWLPVGSPNSCPTVSNVVLYYDESCSTVLPHAVWLSRCLSFVVDGNECTTYYYMRLRCISPQDVWELSWFIVSQDLGPPPCGSLSPPAVCEPCGGAPVFQSSADLSSDPSLCSPLVLNFTFPVGGCISVATVED